MKLWLDDLRPMPPEYDVHVKTVDEATLLIREEVVTHISLDNDLGEGKPEGYEVANLIEFLAFHHLIPPIIWQVHSANLARKQSMIQALQNADKFWQS